MPWTKIVDKAPFDPVNQEYRFVIDDNASGADGEVFYPDRVSKEKISFTFSQGAGAGIGRRQGALGWARLGGNPVEDISADLTRFKLRGRNSA